MEKPKPQEIIKAFDDCLDFVFGRSRGRDYPSKFDEKVAEDWIQEGLTVSVACFVFYHQMSRMHERWLHYSADNTDHIPQHLGIFDKNIRAGIARFKAGGEPVATWEQSESQWKARVRGFYKSGLWLKEQWGDMPTEPNCRVPARLLNEVQEETEKKTSRNN